MRGSWQAACTTSPQQYCLQWQGFRHSCVSSLCSQLDDLRHWESFQRQNMLSSCHIYLSNTIVLKA